MTLPEWLDRELASPRAALAHAAALAAAGALLAWASTRVAAWRRAVQTRRGLGVARTALDPTLSGRVVTLRGVLRCDGGASVTTLARFAGDEQAESTRPAGLALAVGRARVVLGGSVEVVCGSRERERLTRSPDLHRRSLATQRSAEDGDEVLVTGVVEASATDGSSYREVAAAWRFAPDARLAALRCRRRRLRPRIGAMAVGALAAVVVGHAVVVAAVEIADRHDPEHDRGARYYGPGSYCYEPPRNDPEWAAVVRAIPMTCPAGTHLNDESVGYDGDRWCEHAGTRQGPFEEWDERGLLRVRGQFRNGEREGRWQEDLGWIRRRFIPTPHPLACDTGYHEGARAGSSAASSPR